jgi:hypothetical protein
VKLQSAAEEQMAETTNGVLRQLRGFLRKIRRQKVATMVYRFGHLESRHKRLQTSGQEYETGLHECRRFLVTDDAAKLV